MERVALRDGFEIKDLMDQVEAICNRPGPDKSVVVWDMTALSAVPWFQLAPAALALGRVKARLDGSILESIILLPNPKWRMALNAFLSLYTPATPIRVVVGDQEDLEKQLAPVQMSPLG